MTHSTKTNATRSISRPPAPGPKGLPGVGVLFNLIGNPLWYFERMHRQYGDLVRLEVAGKPVHIVSHPDHVKHVLVDNAANYWKGPIFKRIDALFGNGLVLNDGESWKRQRRLMAPSFEQRQIAHLVGLMHEIAAKQMTTWSAACRSGDAIEMQAQMMRITLGIVIKTMFGCSITDAELALIADAFNATLGHLEARLVTFFLPEGCPLPGRAKFLRARTLLYEVVHRIVRERRTAPAEHADLLSLLLESRYDDGERMSDQQLRDEIITIFFGGYEATANALAWTQYAVSQHPGIAARLRQEALSVLGDGPPTLETLARLEYTGRVINEAMRLYPPFYVTFRTAYEDDVIAGHHLPAGSHMLLLHYLTHRDPSFWEQPLVFDPERFTKQASAARPKHAYYPFGAGQHMCIGKHFATLEMKLVTAMVMRDYQLQLAPGSVIEMNPRATLRSRYGIPMLVHDARGAETSRDVLGAELLELGPQALDRHGSHGVDPIRSV